MKRYMFPLTAQRNGKGQDPVGPKKEKPNNSRLLPQKEATTSSMLNLAFVALVALWGNSG